MKNKRSIMYVSCEEELVANKRFEELRRVLPSDTVILVKLNINDRDAFVSYLPQSIEDSNPDIIIGDGLGAFFVHQLSGHDRICINADLHPSFSCSEEYVPFYEDLEFHQMSFDRKTDFQCNTHCWGIFGSKSERRDFAMLHYPNIQVFDKAVDSIDDVLPECVALINTIGNSRRTDDYGVRYCEYGRVLEKADYALFRDVQEYHIPEGVKTIGDCAFYGMDLKRVQLPQSLKYIGESAFRGCPLEEVVIPQHVDRIKEGTFLNCRSLRKVTLPRGLYCIEANAFQGTAIKVVEIPKGCRIIHDEAFDEGVQAVVSMKELSETLKEVFDCNLSNSAEEIDKNACL